jgi:hypothetical protein
MPETLERLRVGSASKDDSQPVWLPLPSRSNGHSSRWRGATDRLDDNRCAWFLRQ